MPRSGWERKPGVAEDLKLLDESYHGRGAVVGGEVFSISRAKVYNAV